MINLLTDNGQAAIKLDRMATLNRPIQAKGIQNTGAICFASSVLQMLFRIDGIRNFILALDDNFKLSPHESSPLLGLKRLFRSLHDPEVKSVKGHGCKFIPGRFARGEQGDADEFFAAWMEILEKVMGNDLQSELFLQVALNRTRFNENKNSTNSNAISNSIISSESWSSIKVTFPQFSVAQSGSGPINLETLLSYENGPFGNEIITSNLRQNYKITSLPKFVTLSFVRTAFDSTRGPVKINTPVQIPENLDLSPYFQTFQSQSQSQNSTATPFTSHLRLKMFVLHSGTAESGHYVAYVRDTEEIWHLIDDERVKQVSTKETLEAVKLSSICIYKQE
jgi:ubiquitin C-terminal hydrolase